jgi:hypothetical protein
MTTREKLHAILGHPAVNVSAIARAYYDTKGGGYRTPANSFHLLVTRQNAASEQTMEDVYNFTVNYIKSILP